MEILDFSPSILNIQERTRLQCMLNCIHGSRNPLCPPRCPDTAWFKNIIKCYEYAYLCYEIISYGDSVNLWKHIRAFQGKMLAKEHSLKRDGHFFAISFFSGACSMCDEHPCRLHECNRKSVGRTPICGTGINIAELCQPYPNLTQELQLSFWKPLLATEYVKYTNYKHLCLGVIFY